MPTQTTAADHIQDLGAYVSASPSSFHAVHEAARRLDGAGFTGLDELQPWTAAAGGKFYVIRDGALIAWVTPEDAGPTTGFNILGAHTDSPSFKLKPKPTTGRFGWLQAGVEVYGGPLLNSWLDRELQLAGRLVMRDGTQHLTATGPLLRFPQLAIHLDRAVNDGLALDKQQHMNPVYGLGDPGRRGPARAAGGPGCRRRTWTRRRSAATTSSSRTPRPRRCSGRRASSSPPAGWTTSPRRTPGSRR